MTTFFPTNPLGFNPFATYPWNAAAACCPPGAFVPGFVPQGQVAGWTNQTIPTQCVNTGVGVNAYSPTVTNTTGATQTVNPSLNGFAPQVNLNGCTPVAGQVQSPIHGVSGIPAHGWNSPLAFNPMFNPWLNTIPSTPWTAGYVNSLGSTLPTLNVLNSLAQSGYGTVNPFVNGVNPFVNAINPYLSNVNPFINVVNPWLNSSPFSNVTNPFVNAFNPGFNGVNPFINAINTALCNPISNSIHNGLVQPTFGNTLTGWPTSIYNQGYSHVSPLNSLFNSWSNPFQTAAAIGLGNSVLPTNRFWNLPGVNGYSQIPFTGVQPTTNFAGFNTSPFSTINTLNPFSTLSTISPFGVPYSLNTLNPFGTINGYNTFNPFSTFNPINTLGCNTPVTGTWPGLTNTILPGINSVPFGAWNNGFVNTWSPFQSTPFVSPIGTNGYTNFSQTGNIGTAATAIPGSYIPGVTNTTVGVNGQGTIPTNSYGVNPFATSPAMGQIPVGQPGCQIPGFDRVEPCLSGMGLGMGRETA